MDDLYALVLTEKELLSVLVSLSDKVQEFTEGNGRIGNPELRAEYKRVYECVQRFYFSQPQSAGKVKTNIALLRRQAE